MIRKNRKTKKTLRFSVALLLCCLVLSQFSACRSSGGNGKSTNESTDVGTTATRDESETMNEEIPKNLALTSAGGFWMENGTLRMNLTSDNPKLNLSGRFGVSLGSKWCLTTDAEGSENLTDDSVTLKEGENVFYVKVSFRSNQFIYKAVVNYHFAYTAEFYSNCAELVPTQTVEKGDQIARPADPTREGYNFLGWYRDGEAFDFDTALTESCKLVAHWDKIDKTKGYYTSETLGYGAIKFEDISAGLHVVWKDYADSNGFRPEEVTCILTQTYGNTTKTYEILLTSEYATWKDSDNAPASYELRQGDGGEWTLALKDLPKTVDSLPCTYTLVQKPLDDGKYTTLQSGSAVVNTLNGYVGKADPSAKLTTRNSRLYDAAGNLIVFQGVVTGNIGWQSLLDTTTPEGLKKLSAIGCNVIRVTMPINGSKSQGIGYAYWSNGSPRTGDYSDDKDERVDEAAKQKEIAAIDEMVRRATDAGLYIILDWAILSSNPYQYVEEACDLFGILAAKYKNNPFVLFEICNEPTGCSWSGAGQIKAYAERVIDVIRANGSDAIVIVGTRGAANYISMSPAVYKNSGDAVGDDPIFDPLNDDRSYNVAYTHHCYPYTNRYADANGRTSFGWRIRDAYDAGLTIISTETSPMDPTFDHRDNIGYDMEQMAMYMRMYQEYDISYCYFRYLNTSSYDEWIMFKPNLQPALRQWTRDDLTECGKWYYDLVTGNGVFITDVNYNARQKRDIRDVYKDTFAAFGLAANVDFTVFPTFSIGGTKVDTGYFFVYDADDTLHDQQYEAYCLRIWTRISAICNGSAKQSNGSAFTTANVPDVRTKPLELTYQYSGKTCTVRISYGQNSADGTWGIFVNIQ